jgi:hypothetical protein
MGRTGTDAVAVDCEAVCPNLEDLEKSLRVKRRAFMVVCLLVSCCRKRDLTNLLVVCQILMINDVTNRVLESDLLARPIG